MGICLTLLWHTGDHVHEALREAFVNTLIHADFTDRISILIVKCQDFYGFRNPGELRLPVEVVLRGGMSDCRNRRLQKMFQLIGAAEQAGSGYPKILRAWGEQHWRYPILDERFQPEQTVLRLPTTSLLPPDAVKELDRRFGRKFRDLDEVARLAVVTALIEEKVTNHRMRTISDYHASDLTTILKSLVNQGFLTADGTGRGTCYRLREQASNKKTEPVADDTISLFSEELHGKSPKLNSEQVGTNSIHDSHLVSIAAPVKTTKNAPSELVRNVILQLCKDDFRSLRILSELLARQPVSLRTHYISPLIDEGRLEYEFPDKTNHPKQRYRTVKQSV
jgi:ATP-dependent DNA helicase RecG